MSLDDLYPGHCKRCNGTGEIVYYDDPSPAGVALSPGVMEFSDPCPDCVEQGLCPRCLGPLTGGEGYPVMCNACNFVVVE